MSRSNPTVLFGFFVAVIVAICGASLLKGGLYIGKHEGDTLHLIEIVLRMAAGEWPHLDFMTPIGALAFAPIVLFVDLGYGIGTAFLLAQALVVVVLLPAVWWVAWTRLRGVLPYLFGLIVIVLVTALVHGEAERSISLSMHYNRWAWAISFLAIVIAMLPHKERDHPVADGLIVGLAMAALVLVKVTYFAAFAVPVALGLVLRGSFGTLFVAVLAGLAVAGAVTLVAGVEYWQAYLGDLLTVAQSSLRPAPGDSLQGVIGAPARIGGSLVLVLGVILLRQADRGLPGLILLLLVPGFFYVTYQNFANDPQWLLLLGVLLMALLPPIEMRNGFGWEMGTALKIAGVAALALEAPTLVNLATSPFRHFGADEAAHVPVLPRSELHSDLLAAKVRTTRVMARVPLDGFAADIFGHEEEPAKPVSFQGETLPDCEVELGFTVFYDTIASDLEKAGFAQGQSLFTADVLSSFWLYGPLVPLKGGAPWYYGGLPGFENADYLLVPLCPILPGQRRQILKAVEESGQTMTELRRASLYVLYGTSP